MGVFPVGRLDKDTEGLLLMTNDGETSHYLLSPKRHVDKVYYVETEGEPDMDDVEALRQGITLLDGTVCLPAELRLLGGCRSEITLREGKYHQVKRMMAARGKPVRYLKRISFGPLVLDEDLKKGEWRFLTEEEREKLSSAW
jgi:16S rRNA pseudouridine516 synthase